MERLTLRRIGFRPALWIALGFGAGLVRKGPGTVGTLAAVPLVLLIDLMPLPVQITVWMVIFFGGCIVCQLAADWLDDADPGAIVWDEIAGYCLAMAFLPVTLHTLVLAFILFRLLDIFKPWPIRWVEKRVGGGFGIMLDDALAGVATNLLLHGLIFVGFVAI